MQIQQHPSVQNAISGTTLWVQHAIFLWSVSPIAFSYVSLLSLLSLLNNITNRAIVKEPLDSGAKFGSIIVAIGSQVLTQEPFVNIRTKMTNEIRNKASVSLTFGVDEEFTALLKEEILPRFARSQKLKAKKARLAAAQQAVPKPPETINLLDDD